MIPIRDDQPHFTPPVVNYFLIVLNLVIYLFEAVLPPDNLNLLIYQFGLVPWHVTALLTGSRSLNPVAVLTPFLTSMFLHGGWMHVIGNMWFLWIFGDNIEDYLGHFKYLGFYLFAGVAAALTQVLLTPALRVPTVGASGAIAGVMGAYFILYPRARVLTWLVFFFYLPAWVILGYWFLVQFFSARASSLSYASQSSGGVAFWAHVGGFITGLVLVKILPRRRQSQRYGTW
ncbi:MAG TPA: rhomboid family intramembrane serine protease [Terriglobales bacterium]|nr:rhomboid family intramembrane serine protease [Terriglobales bacterium]